MTQGQSQETPHKLRGIDAAMRMQLSIAKPILARTSFATYFHFDLFAGSGVNDKIDGCEPLPGSPVVAQRVLLQSNSRHLMCAVERNKESASALAKILRTESSCFVVEADNREFIPAIPDVIQQHRERPGMAIGSCLIDPNKPSEVDWKAINTMLLRCSRLDVIVNFPGTAEKRKRYASQAGCSIDFNLLDDLPKMCERKHWLIRDACAYGNHQFCLCVGRNKDFGDYRAEGFVRWESESGKLIRSRIMNNDKDHRRYVETMSGQRRFGFA